MGVRLAHVCFESDDLDKTETFYNILGMERRFEFRNLQDELVGYYLAFDNQTYIEVIKTAKLAKPGLIRHFAIEVDSVDDVYDALKSNGIDVTEKELAGDEEEDGGQHEKSIDGGGDRVEDEPGLLAPAC